MLKLFSKGDTRSYLHNKEIEKLNLNTHFKIKHKFYLFYLFNPRTQRGLTFFKKVKT